MFGRILNTPLSSGNYALAYKLKKFQNNIQTTSDSLELLNHTLVIIHLTLPSHFPRTVQELQQSGLWGPSHYAYSSGPGKSQSLGTSNDYHLGVSKEYKQNK